jgi:outer membrane protein assembly factor BamB
VSAKTAKVIMRFSAQNGVRPLRRPLLPGYDAVADGHGGWYVAGVGLAHLRHDGQLDHSWHSPLQRKLVTGTLQRAGSRLYVSDGRRVFALDARTGRKLWASAMVVRSSGIHTLATDGTVVYVGGVFGFVAREPRLSLAAFDARTGRLLPWRPPRLVYYKGTTPLVSALAVTPTTLYLGGGFTAVDGVPRADAAAVRRDNGTVTAFVPRLADEGVYAIAAAGGVVLIGGSVAGGAYDPRTGKQLKGYKSVFNAFAIDVRGQTAYLGGTIRDQIPLHNLLAIDVRTGERRTWFPNVAKYMNVRRIAVSGDRVFVGGELCSSIG